ncbi:MAG: methylmalonyl-CoA mutase family protein, partial [Cyclobacteriaceae bacterium]|nr:methylmalonyl-CoA mutase family protein [Cyclobacteriaceae bacterium]
MEYLRYMRDQLVEKKSSHIKIFAGGGGVILPDEIEELHHYGIERIYSPDDGRKMGLQGMINDLIEKSDFQTISSLNGESKNLSSKNDQNIARLISAAENHRELYAELLKDIKEQSKNYSIPVLGITGTGGAGKSSLVDELVRRFLFDSTDKTIGIISVDPSKRKTGGALLGDRIRMNSINNDRVYMRSLATRQANLALSKHVDDAVHILKAAQFDLIILETSGIGQSDTEITEHCDASLYVMTPEYGAATQLEKIDMLDFADVIAINKFDKRGAQDALRDVKKQYQRNHLLFDTPVEELPVFGTIASQFNDPGTNKLYLKILDLIQSKTGILFKSSLPEIVSDSEKTHIIPPNRTRYLSEITEVIHSKIKWIEAEADKANSAYVLNKTLEIEEIKSNNDLLEVSERYFQSLDIDSRDIINGWNEKIKKYKAPEYLFKVRNKEFSIKNYSKSLSNSEIPKISTPKFRSWGDIIEWSYKENFPGEFPYTAGIYPFKRENEDPTRMFAGEGGPERTNRRFHYVSASMPAKRLSTAFDSVTLYGNDPDYRPDIYGKIGNSGVSVCCVDDAKKLYSGFDLAEPTTSVSMTINGPAPMLLAYFMNAAIDQQCEKYIHKEGLTESIKKKIEEKFKAKGVPQPQYNGSIPEGNNGLGLMLLGMSGDEVLPPEIYQKIKTETLSKVRGTVQADILKEDQA